MNKLDTSLSITDSMVDLVIECDIIHFSLYTTILFIPIAPIAVSLCALFNKYMYKKYIQI